MSKTLSVAVGALAIIAAGTTGVAWYTGTQVEPLLRQQVDDANGQLQAALAVHGATGTVEVTEFDRGVFTSSARGVMTVQGPGFNGGQPLQVETVADIEHGPFPWSRIKRLELLPVMLAVHAQVQNNEALAQWFDTKQGESPIQAWSAISYSRHLQSQFKLLPGQWQGQQGTFTYSGLDGSQRGNLDGETLEVDASVARFEFAASDPAHPMTLQIHGLKFHTGGIKGTSGFYLGNSALHLDRMAVSTPARPPFQLDNLDANSTLEELNGKLKGSADYRFEQSSVAGKPIGSGQLRLLFDNLDIDATRNLARMFEDVVAPQAMVAAQAHQPFQLQLSAQQQAELQDNLEKLLDGHPHIELQPLGLKTVNGESHLTVALDLARPAVTDLPPALLARQMITRLDARLSVAKGTIRDLVTVQGQLDGVTNPGVLAMNAIGAANLAATLAVLQGLATVEGNSITTSLRYDADVVDFNGQKMTVAQFGRFLLERLPEE